MSGSGESRRGRPDQPPGDYSHLDTNLQGCGGGGGFLLTLYGSVGELHHAPALMATVQSARITASRGRVSSPPTDEPARAWRRFLPHFRLLLLFFFLILICQKHPPLRWGGKSLMCRLVLLRIAEKRPSATGSVSPSLSLSPHRASPSYGAGTFHSTVLSFVCEEAILRQRTGRETI